MSPRYMLDTNAFSDLVKNPSGRVAKAVAHLEETRNAKISISIVVAAEVRYGIAKKDSEELRKQVEAVLAVIEIVPLGAAADKRYAQIRTDLERSGQIISANDYFIAAHALAMDSILVTNNVREFARVKGLRIENWLESGK
jgi:tRNA(fMet)-specific endonuclease VapC